MQKKSFRFTIDLNINIELMEMDSEKLGQFPPVIKNREEKTPKKNPRPKRPGIEHLKQPILKMRRILLLCFQCLHQGVEDVSTLCLTQLLL